MLISWCYFLEQSFPSSLPVPAKNLAVIGQLSMGRYIYYIFPGMWRVVAIHHYVLQYVARCGNSSLYGAICGNSSLHGAICGDVWQFIITWRNMWRSVAIHHYMVNFHTSLQIAARNDENMNNYIHLLKKTYTFFKKFNRNIQNF